MNLILASIGVFLGIILLLVVILLVAKQYLTPSGKVKITINGEKELEVEQGSTLLNTLSVNGIYLSSACGGKGSCGQCKCQVVEGGGEILPSEKGHFSRKQQQDHWRLGCQVKVKGDLGIKIDESVMGVKEWECEVISNKNVATFIKEFIVALPKGEHMDFVPGSYAQIKIPKFEMDYNKDIDKDLIGPEYLPAWEKFGLFGLKCKNTEETIRAYSMANYPAEGDRIMLTVRIATPPFKPKDQGPGFMDVNPGIASSYIFTLKPGDKVTMSGPYGDFHPIFDSKKEMIWVGGGAGMAPLRAQIMHMTKTLHTTDRELHYFYGARALNEVFYLQDFQQLEKDFPNFHFHLALPENRKYICKIVRDIVTRYDVDAIHMDDYFYPYPNPGEDFPDHVSFAQYGRGYSNKADWRRDNVNVLIKEIHETVRECKPWVKFGVSPFGIYRNKKNDPNGSDTRGLQNYDDLYADVLMWINNGWVDYNIPQIYWEIGHPAADYDNLIHWWAKHAASRPLFIGQDVMRTVNKADARNPLQNQMPAKMKLQRSLPTVQGSCQWYAAAVVDNAGNYRTMLEKEYHRYPALIPESPFMDDKAPGKVKKVKMVWTYEGPVLFWTAPKAKDEMDKAVQYVVYRFDKKEKVNLDDASHIVAITRDHFYPLPYNDGKTKYQYVVTALDRLHNESKGTKKKVKL